MSTHPIHRGRRYKRLILVMTAVGVAALLGGMAVDQHLPGLVVYALAVAGVVGLTAAGRLSSSVTLQDERERELGRRASDLTFRLFGYLGLFAFVALFLLDAGGYHQMGAAATTLLTAYAAVSLTWGAVYLGLRRWR